MQKWEYKVETRADSQLGDGDVQRWLDALGLDGWELVTCTADEHEYGPLKFILKRPLDA